MNYYHSQTGFALLITLVVVSIVLAIGLSLMQITLKQLQLTVNARESEVAFYAANAGIECAQAMRLGFDPFDENTGIPANLWLGCVGSGVPVPSVRSNNNRTHLYQHNFTWNMSIPGVGLAPLCSQVKIFILDARDATYMHTFTNLGLENKTCEEGTICTVMFSTGYNKACNNLGGLQTVQRELTIEG